MKESTDQDAHCARTAARRAENAAGEMLRTARHERDRLRLLGVDVSALEHVLRALEAKHAVIANEATSARDRYRAELFEERSAA